jgi:ABC-type lipoprotein release transport system permease subunit
MNLNSHINVLDFTLQSLLRRKFKNLGIMVVFTFVVFITGSILFLSYSFKREAMLILKGSPELIVQRLSAGRHELVPLTIAKYIERIPGVSSVDPHYWGYYYDALVKANYTVVAASAPVAAGNRLLNGRLPGRNETGVAAVGSGVAKVRFADLGGTISLLSSSGDLMDFQVVGVFKPDSGLLTSDLLVLGQPDVIKFFSMPKEMATDLAVSVSDKSAAAAIAGKIRKEFPDARLILRNEIIRAYEAVLGWRSGLVVTLFAGALTAFIILVWDKASGLGAEEKKEIGILKAIGWETSDIIEMKFWEGLAVSFSSFLTGIILAYLHVYYFAASMFAPALKGWSVIFPDFRLMPFIDPYLIVMLMTLTVVPYIASTVVPSWKSAITDPDVVVRG